MSKRLVVPCVAAAAIVGLLLAVSAWRSTSTHAGRGAGPASDTPCPRSAPCAEGDPQDPPRRDHHAGEPLVRLLLRDVSRRGRDPRSSPGTQARVPCVPDPQLGHCVKPFHDPANGQSGGAARARRRARRHRRRQDERVRRSRAAGSGRRTARRTPISPPYCPPSQRVPDVMGYHDRREIPNYWAYADRFVLQDHMFQPDSSWSLPSHLFLVSGWSARCTTTGDPMSCEPAVQAPDPPPGTSQNTTGKIPHYAWTDLTWLLHRNHVSWGYYVARGHEPDCKNDKMFCAPVPQNATTSGIVNPLPWFDDVHEDHELSNLRPLTSFERAAKAGTLPAVSWVAPTNAVSEHPPSSIAAGQAYVTALINMIMHGPDWKSTAIFLAWDDWGGFFDHVQPPAVDCSGLRDPGSGSRHQPVREEGVHRPPDAELRRVPQVHRGRLPSRPAARSAYRRETGFEAERPREREGSRQPRQGLQLQAEAPPAAATSCSPTRRLDRFLLP